MLNAAYAFEVILTHDVDVTISHDPMDTEGWPSTATHYTVVLHFDDVGTPHTLTAQLPPGTVTAPQTVTFYVYVLWADVSRTHITLDIYDSQGSYLASTPDLAAQRITVDYWRDLFAQNAQVLRLPNGALPPRTEPSISRWIPSTP